jgi:hypothetical protein
VDLHTRGVICAGEVWNQFVDFHMVQSVDEWVRVLTPPLQNYFRAKTTESDLSNWQDEERAALRRLNEWYEKHAG